VEDGEDLVGAVFEGGEGDPADAFVDGAFDGGGYVLELFVNLIAGLGGGTSGADELSGQGGEAYLIGGVEEVSGTDEGGAADDREFVVF